MPRAVEKEFAEVYQADTQIKTRESEANEYATRTISEAKAEATMRKNIGLELSTYFSKRREEYFFDYVKDQLFREYGGAPYAAKLDELFAIVTGAGGAPRLTGSGPTIFHLAENHERAAALAERLTHAGLPVPEWHLTNAAFEPPALLYGVNPFARNHEHVSAGDDAATAARRVSRRGKFAICCQQLPPDAAGEVGCGRQMSRCLAQVGGPASGFRTTGRHEEDQSYHGRQGEPAHPAVGEPLSRPA